MNSAASEFEEQLAALTRDYVSGLPDKIDEIDSVVASIAPDATADEARDGLKTLNHLTHQLAGSGATFGLPDVSTAARDIENITEALLENGAALSAKSRREMEGLVVVLRRIVADGPAGVPPSAAVSAPDDAPAADDEPEKTILLIEGDPGRPGELSGQLAKFGFTVESLPGTDGLAAAVERHRPLALIMDMTFTEGDDAGAEGIWRLRQDGAVRCPIVFVSDDGGLEARLVGVRVGCDAFLVKPVDINEFVDVIDRLTTAERAEPFRVLIVDDDPSTADHTSLILEGAGMITSTVIDPTTILDELDVFAPELILLDLYMPGCNGQELAKVIRQQEAYAAVPIVFLSSERDPDKQLGAMSHGGDDFLTKTIRPDHLIASVRVRAMRFRTLRTMMIHDSLTGLLNHSTTLQFLDNEIERARRNEVPLSFAMLDIDRFKSVNDAHGHAVGDQVIKSLATLLKRRLRRVDVVGRMGGEEFGVILAGTADDTARDVMDEVRSAFADIRHRAGEAEITVTVSCGIAQFPTHGTGPALVEAADAALYTAKRSGRDRVVLAAA